MQGINPFEGAEGFTAIAAFTLGALAGAVAVYRAVSKQERTNAEQENTNNQFKRDIKGIGECFRRDDAKLRARQGHLIAALAKVEEDPKKREILLNELTRDDEQNS
jgi:hypothetical protein